MQRRHTAPAEPLPPAGLPTLHDMHGNSTRRPRQMSAVRMRSLSMPKGSGRPSLAAPAFVPWDRSLRSAQPTYIPGPGFGSTRRSTSKSSGHHGLPDIRPRAASAAVPGGVDGAPVTLQPSPPPPAGGGGVGAAGAAAARRGSARRRSSAFAPPSPLIGKAAAMSNSTTEGGDLSTSLLEAATAEAAGVPSRRPSSHHQQRAVRVVLGRDTRDDAAALAAYTSPNAIIFAAYDTLRLLLIPLWRRHRYHRQLARATATVAKFVLAKVHARRRRQRAAAADLIVRVLRVPRTRLLCAARQLEVRVVRIQRAYRLHRQAVQAVVELNLRKVRRDVEVAYWAAVVARRETELAAQEPATSAVAKAVQEVLEAKRDVHTRFGVVKRASLAGNAGTTSTSAATAAAAARTTAPTSYELDVYNYYMIGRLPETTLRSEIAAAVFAYTRRSAERARLLDDLCTPKHPKRTEATALNGRTSSSAATALSVRKGSNARIPRMRSAAHLPRFLPEEVYTSIMNNACYMTSLLRDDGMLRAHLKPRTSSLEPY